MARARIVGDRVSGEFLAAYAGTSAAQAALVAGAAGGSLAPSLRTPRHRLFALIPVLSLVSVVFGLRAWPEAAGALSKGALVLVPLLALLAALRSGRIAFLGTLGMLAVTLCDGHSLAGQLAGLGLVGGSCALLGALLVDLTPPRWLGAGIAAMALADLVLVTSGLLDPANAALNAAGVTRGLPQFQRVELGPLTMGYGDLFLPAVVGALLSARARTRRWVAALTFGFALAAAGVFLVADELPATVPVALALLVVEGAGVLGALARRMQLGSRAPDRATSAAPPHYDAA